MPEDNQLNWQNPKPAGFPSPAPRSPAPPPPPPPPEITIRTMKSDLESLKETGGGVPTPKPFTPPELTRDFSRPAAPPPPLPTKIAPSDFSAARKSETPELPQTKPLIEEEAAGQAKSNLKKIFSWVVIIAIAAGVGLIGYFYIFPILFPKQTPPAPAAKKPITEIPIVTAVPPAEKPIQQPETPPAPISHQSLLNAPDFQFVEQLPTLNLNFLAAAFQQEAAKSLPTGSLAELTLNDANGQIPAPLALSVLFPELSPDNLNKYFEDDFTAALYFDADGAWPAYIFKLKPESSPAEAQTAVAKLESSQNLENLFVSDPGDPNAGGFKTGQANGTATRYLPYSKKSASLNFSWSKDKLIISASYSGLKKILGNL